MRFLNDVAVTCKATDKLTFITEGNYAHDDALGGVNAYGIAQYASYQVYDWLKVNGRAEIFRDNNGFFTAEFPGNFDFVNAEHGYANGALFAAPTTYLELTTGLTITPTLPTGVPYLNYLKGLIFRPEIRYDRSLNGTTPYAGFTQSSSFTLGGDLIAKF